MEQAAGWTTWCEAASGLSAGIAAFLVLVLLGALSGWVDPGAPSLTLLAGIAVLAIAYPRLRTFATAALGGFAVSCVVAAVVVVAYANV